MKIFITLNLDNGFLAMTLRALVTKGKNKLDFIKIKNFCTLKDTIKQVKTTHKIGERIAGHLSHNGLVSRI